MPMGDPYLPLRDNVGGGCAGTWIAHELLRTERRSDRRSAVAPSRGRSGATRNAASSTVKPMWRSRRFGVAESQTRPEVGLRWLV